MRSWLAILPLFAVVAWSACSESADAPPIQPTSAVEAAITINQPQPRDSVSVPFAISGSADVFEAALSVRVLDASGAVLCEHNIQATAGSGTRGNWTTTMAFVPPQGELTAGPVEATIRAFSYSAENGAEINIIERPISLLAEPPDIVVTEPPCAARVPRTTPLDVAGTAQVFEAALTVELQRADGTAVLTQSAMALSGIERSPWSTQLDLSSVEPGLYTLVALSFSAEDGSRINEFPIPLEVIE